MTVSASITTTSVTLDKLTSDGRVLYNDNFKLEQAKAVLARDEKAGAAPATINKDKAAVMTASNALQIEETATKNDIASYVKHNIFVHPPAGETGTDAAANQASAAVESGSELAALTAPEDADGTNQTAIIANEDATKEINSFVKGIDSSAAVMIENSQPLLPAGYGSTKFVDNNTGHTWEWHFSKGSYTIAGVVISFVAATVIINPGARAEALGGVLVFASLVENTIVQFTGNQNGRIFLDNISEALAQGHRVVLEHFGTGALQLDLQATAEAVANGVVEINAFAESGNLLVNANGQAISAITDAAAQGFRVFTGFANNSGFNIAGGINHLISATAQNVGLNTLRAGNLLTIVDATVRSLGFLTLSHATQGALTVDGVLTNIAVLVGGGGRTLVESNETSENSAYVLASGGEMKFGDQSAAPSEKAKGRCNIYLAQSKTDKSSPARITIYSDEHANIFTGNGADDTVDVYGIAVVNQHQVRKVLQKHSDSEDKTIYAEDLTDSPIFNSAGADTIKVRPGARVAIIGAANNTAGSSQNVDIFEAEGASGAGGSLISYQALSSNQTVKFRGSVKAAELDIFIGANISNFHATIENWGASPSISFEDFSQSKPRIPLIVTASETYNSNKTPKTTYSWGKGNEITFVGKTLEEAARSLALGWVNSSAIVYVKAAASRPDTIKVNLAKGISAADVSGSVTPTLANKRYNIGDVVPVQFYSNSIADGKVAEIEIGAKQSNIHVGDLIVSTSGTASGGSTDTISAAYNNISESAATLSSDLDRLESIITSVHEIFIADQNTIHTLSFTPLQQQLDVAALSKIEGAAGKPGQYHVSYRAGSGQTLSNLSHKDTSVNGGMRYDLTRTSNKSTDVFSFDFSESKDIGIGCGFSHNANNLINIDDTVIISKSGGQFYLKIYNALTPNNPAGIKIDSMGGAETLRFDNITASIAISPMAAGAAGYKGSLALQFAQSEAYHTSPIDTFGIVPADYAANSLTLTNFHAYEVK